MALTLHRSNADRPGEPSPRYVTIKTILQKTGIHRQTVHYYLRREILPPPVRTSRTSALYTSATIDLIQLVQWLQKQHRLSLDEITGLFRQHGHDPKAIKQAVQSRAGSSSIGGLAGAPAPVALEEAVAAMDPAPPKEWVEQVIANGTIRHQIRDGRRVISPDAVEALRAAWEGTRAGASAEQLKQMALAMDKQVQWEFEYFLKSLHQLPASREAGPQVTRLFTSLERFGAHRRRDGLQNLFLARLSQSSSRFLGPDRTYLFPSRTFLQKMGLFRELDLLLRELDRKPDDLEVLRRLARACYLSSDWARLQVTAQDILRVAPNDPSALANYGQALHSLGRTQEAVTYLEEVVARGVNPMAKIRLGQAALTLGRQSGDAARLLDAVVRQTRLAAEAVRESHGNPALHRKVRLTSVLDKLYYCDSFGLNRPVAKDVEALYEEFRALPDKKLATLPKISLVMSRIYATYALYLIRLEEKNPKAEQLLAEIAKLDPDCLLATRKARTRGK